MNYTLKCPWSAKILLLLIWKSFEIKRNGRVFLFGITASRISCCIFISCANKLLCSSVKASLCVGYETVDSQRGAWHRVLSFYIHERGVAVLLKTPPKVQEPNKRIKPTWKQKRPKTFYPSFALLRLAIGFKKLVIFCASSVDNEFT